jgi:CHAD domain-containing protein
MRIAVLAHVRGNKAALDAVLEAIDALDPKPDRVVAGGDHTGDGPHGKRVEKTLAKRGLLEAADIHDGNPDAEKILLSVRSGYPNAGDPRASFALVITADGKPPIVEHGRVPYALRKTTRAMLRRIDRSLADPKSGLEYLRGLLGDKALIDKDPPLSADLKGADLTIALLATRIHRVYGIASLDWPDDDVEHVHDLRVATRRLREALMLASGVLPKKSVEKANRRARDLGRALGQRRIYDVFLEEARSIAKEQKLELSSFLTSLEAQRDRATIQICLSYSKRRLLHHGLALLETSMWPKDQEPSLAELAPPSLDERIADVEAQLPCIDDESAHDAHHELRIKLKHLRYSAEILRSAWPLLIELEETVTPIKELQDGLGELNDARELVSLAREHTKSADLDRFVEHIESSRAERFQRASNAVKTKLPAVIAKMRAIAQAIRGEASTPIARAADAADAVEAVHAANTPGQETTPAAK